MILNLLLANIILKKEKKEDRKKLNRKMKLEKEIKLKWKI